MWKHSLVVELSSDVGVEAACVSLVLLLLWRRWLLLDGVVLLGWVLRAALLLDLVRNDGPLGIIRRLACRHCLRRRCGHGWWRPCRLRRSGRLRSWLLRRLRGWLWLRLSRSLLSIRLLLSKGLLPLSIILGLTLLVLITRVRLHDHLLRLT